MRAWWEDALIGTLATTVGTVIALAIVAVAGKAAGLFKRPIDFDTGRFVQVLAALIGVIAGLIGGVGAIVEK
jgi:hypothetical protein